MGPFVEAGVQRVYLQVLDMSDLDHLELFAARSPAGSPDRARTRRPRLLSVPVTGDRDDDSDARPWHERTATVVGASIAGLVVIGILVLLVSYVSKQYNQPEPPPQYFVDEPSGSSSAISSSSATTTTEIITSTSPPVTTDINPGDETTTSSTDTSSTATSSTDTSGSETSTSTTTTTTTRRPPETDDDGPTTTRNRPRLNETRTLYPRP